jgi:Phage endonuclease I
MASAKPALTVEPQYRSRLEKKVADQLAASGVDHEYESFKVPYLVPARTAHYLPDFPVAGRTVLLEAKGWLKVEDRKKLIHIRESHPTIDLRLIFQNANNKIYKGSPTTYAKWADDHGFLWCDKGTIPDEWLREFKRKPKKRK